MLALVQKCLKLYDYKCWKDMGTKDEKKTSKLIICSNN